MTVKVLFVCLGNICRSPLAEAAFRAEAARVGLDAEADSAGRSNPRNASTAVRFASESAANALREAVASPPCRRITSRRLMLRPSCWVPLSMCVLQLFASLPSVLHVFALQDLYDAS